MAKIDTKELITNAQDLQVLYTAQAKIKSNKSEIENIIQNLEDKILKIANKGKEV